LNTAMAAMAATEHSRMDGNIGRPRQLHRVNERVPTAS
jgi:hypothetical protein